MDCTVRIYYEERYLPTKKHRNLRKHVLHENISIEVPEIEERNFPLAFRVVERGKVTEVRTYRDCLWKVLYYNQIISNTEGCYPVAETSYLLRQRIPFCAKGLNSYFDKYKDSAIIKDNNREECIENAKCTASNYVIFDGKVLYQTGEPMYNIQTFGLGNNHGGTGFFIDWEYNPNLSAECYFNAFDREAAVAYGREVATRRGDTNDVERMGEGKLISVYMPEMVRRNPLKDHGSGCSFLRAAEELIGGTSSPVEAALLLAALTGSTTK